MTTLELVPLSETEETDDPDDLVHWYCEDCYPTGERAFCGADISGDEELTDEDFTLTCKLCLMLDECPKCEW